MLPAAVFFLSLSSLTFEVLLARVFSISQWNHLSFMVISIALFGFAASGILLSLKEGRRNREESPHSEESVCILVFCYFVSAAGSFIALNRLPLDYLRLPVEPIQAVYLLAAYLLLALPFFFTGLAVCTAYAFLPEKTGLIYFFSMSGSALGAAVPFPLLPVLGEEKLIVLTAALPLIIVVFAWRRVRKHIFLPVASALFALAFFLLTPKAEPLIRVNPSSYKPLAQTLRFPKTETVETRSNLRGRIDHVRSPFIRFAPGLSLKFRGSLPGQEAIYRDGDSPITIYALKDAESTRFCRYTLSFAGYLLAPAPERTLIVLSGGGMSIPCAAAAGSIETTIVQEHPDIARILENRCGLPVVNESPLSFLKRHPKPFSVIQIENWGASLPGTAALDQDDGLTIDALIAYLTALTDRGVLILNRKLLLPPADSLRLFAASREALNVIGMNAPENHIAILRNWDTFTLIVSKKPLADLDPVRSFARKMNFDLVYLPGMSKEEANRFNLFENPYHYLEISRLDSAYRSGTEAGFFRSYLLDVAPQGKNRPFPNRYMKWSRLQAQFKSTGSRLYSLFLSGEVVVAVVFLEAVAVSLLLLGVPTAVFLRGRLPAAASGLFFSGVGAGFMFVELYFIKAMAVVTGNPVVSFTLVLAGIMIFSGAGGYVSQRLTERNLRTALTVLSVLLAAAAFCAPALNELLMILPEPARSAGSFLLLFPFGFLMGIPFPLGMRCLLKNPGQRAYGWAINGCASVVSAIAAAQIALSFGIRQILLCGVVSYLCALLCVIKEKRE